MKTSTHTIRIMILIVSSVASQGSGGRNGRDLYNDQRQFQCNSEGFHPDPRDCSIFYRCVDWSDSSENTLQSVKYTAMKFQCGFGSIFDTDTGACVHPAVTSRSECRQGVADAYFRRAPDMDTAESSYYNNYEKAKENPDYGVVRPQGGSQQQQQQPQPSQSYGNNNNENVPNGNKNVKCEAEGFFPVQGECKRFYRCVSNGRSYTKYEFTCGEGTIWDPDNNACNYPWAISRADCKTTSNEGGNQGYVNESEKPPSEQWTDNVKPVEEPPEDNGVSENPVNRPQYGGVPASSQTNSPNGGGYQPANNGNRPTNSEYQPANGGYLPPDSGNEQNGYQPEGNEENQTENAGNQPGTTSTCSSEGFHPVEGDCKKFIRCVSNGNGGYTKYDFECGEGTVWDEELDTCNYPYAVQRANCGMRTSPPPGAMSDSTISGQTSTTSQWFNNSSSQTSSSMSSSTSYMNSSSSSSSQQTTSNQQSSGSSSSQQQTTSSGSNQQSSGSNQQTAASGSNQQSSGSNQQTTASGSNQQSSGSNQQTTASGSNQQSSGSNQQTTASGSNQQTTSTGSNQQTSSSASNQQTTSSGSNQQGTQSTNNQQTSQGQTSSNNQQTSQGQTSSNNQQTTGPIGNQQGTTRPMGQGSNNQGATKPIDNGNPQQESTKPSGQEPTMTTTQPVPNGQGPNSPNKGNKCEGEGFFPSSQDCSKFYRCVANPSGHYTKYEFACGPGTVWDPDNNVCNHPWAVTRDCKQGNDASPSTNSPSSTGATEQQTVAPEKPGGSSSPSSSTDKPNTTSPKPGKPSKPQKPVTGTPNQNSKPTSTSIPPKPTNSTPKSTISPSKPTKAPLTPTPSPSKPTNKPDKPLSKPTNNLDKPGNTSSTGKPTTKRPPPGAPPVSASKPPPSASQTTSKPPSNATEPDNNNCNQTTPAKSPGKITCTKAGYYPHPDDCKKFYRCVDWDGDKGKRFSVYYFDCPEGTIFDPSLNVCNHAESVYPPRDCSGSPNGTTESSTDGPQTTEYSTTPTDLTTQPGDQSTVTTDSSTNEQSTAGTEQTTTPGGTEQTTAGTEPSSTDQSSTDQSTMEPATEASTSESTTNDYSTPSNEETTTNKVTTDSSTMQSESTEESTTPYTTTEMAVTTPMPPEKCPELSPNEMMIVCPTGFRRHPKHCNLFYQCTVSQSNEMKVLTLSCPNGTVFDDAKIQCLPPDQAQKCQGSIAETRSFRKLSDGSLPPVPAQANKKICPGKGFFEYKDDCGMFYKCVEGEDKKIKGFLYECPEGYTFWPISRKCEKSNKVPCDSGKRNVGKPSLAPVERKNIGHR